MPIVMVLPMRMILVLIPLAVLQLMKMVVFKVGSVEIGDALGGGVLFFTYCKK